MRHVSVCVPTFKRPNTLDRCLASLVGQTCVGFTISIVVVDNDLSQSAADVVSGWSRRSSIHLVYDVEPVQSISLARNRAVANSSGNFVAFIDDDEIPESDWVLRLVTAYDDYGVDGVLGPVVPSYVGRPPRWLVKSGLCDRTSLRSGTRLVSTRDMRTGNVLLGRHIFETEAVPFDPQFGRTGGEDTDFFRRMLVRGRSFVWCEEARVFEEVPTERQTRSYQLRRALVRGVNSAHRESALSLNTLKSIIAVVIYTGSLPVLLLVGHHLFMRYLVRDCDHIAKLCAYCGIRLTHERTF